MSRRRIVLGSLLALFVLCAGLVGALLDAIHPERADPTLVGARPPRVVRTVGAAAAPPVEVDALHVTVAGVVTDPDGEPIPGADVSCGETVVYADADGAYTLPLPYEECWVGADAEGFEGTGRLNTRGERDGEGWRLDFTLEPRHEVRVFCAGLPDDVCGETLIQCTSPWAFVGDPCRNNVESGETTCTCPDGEAAVRGGGRAVLIDGDETEAWLDFRDAGTLVGRVAVNGAAPEECRVVAVRIPTAFEDLPRGLVAVKQTGCEADGSFVLHGLAAGDWEVAATGRRPDPEYVGDELERVLVPRAIRPRSTVDVGTIELTGGGAIEGVLVDGLTGQRLPEAPLLALREGEGGERVTAMPVETDKDGSFRLAGLPTGRWTLAHPLSPQERTAVIVHDGQTTRGVTVRTSDATALDENGFALAEEEGRLVVSDVTPSSPAYEAGLEPGEEIVGVLIGGVDVAAVSGNEGRSASFARTVLGSWDGPGVTLVVRTPEGEREEVPLDW